MTEISINGKKYRIVPKGYLNDGIVKLKKINNIAEIEEDYNDDIVVRDKAGNLFAISADELDVKGTLLRPYIGLPEGGEEIILYGEQGEVILEGVVVCSDPEDDHTTYMNSKK